MADFSALISQIQADIKTNLNQEITGAILQQDLLAMVNLINQLKQDTLAGYSFYGAALSNGDSVNVTQNTFFLAGAGTYTINGTNIVIADNGISLIVYDSVNDILSDSDFFLYDPTPTQGSTNGITSGGVYAALADKQDKDTDAVSGNVAMMDSNGNSVDAGIAVDDLALTSNVGLAEAVLDTDSAGTEQEFTMRQSGGDGGAYYRRILGKSIAWNQLVDANTTSVTIPSGRKYVSYINGTWAYGTSDGTAMAVTGGTDMVFDLTLMGSADDITSVSDFTEKYYLPYFDYNAGSLKHNAVTGVKSVGINLWDEEWEAGKGINPSTGEIIDDPTCCVSKNFIPVLGGVAYYLQNASWANRRIGCYDADKNFISFVYDSGNGAFTTPSNCAYLLFFWNGTTYNHDICINLSDASVNGTYFPHWSRSLDLDITTKEDTNGNIPFPNGLMGAGSAADWADRVGGEIRMGIVDLGDLEWYYSTGNQNPIFYTTFNAGGFNSVCSKYECTNVEEVAFGFSGKGDKLVGISASQLFVRDDAYSDAATFAAAMSGQYLVYELATPVPFKWKTPLNLGIKVDELGTEQALPALASTPTSAPFRAMTTYTMSVARMMDKLNNI